ncbi:MAG: hypothetical protein JRE47_13480, partial [Deltaproteobacteria bacterium]|nr:hypothetical protein [Deltaproteobacteria bacterium]
YEEERLKACDDEHRKISLEHVAVNYQLFRNEKVSDEEAEKRQQVIWRIFDKYYHELPDKSKETESDKTWRLYLARMDRRKMKPTTEKKEGQVLINLNPEMDSELKEYSEASLRKISEPMKYTSLKLWASYKIRNDEQYRQHVQYENNPQLALKEVEEIIDNLEKTKDKIFYLFNYSIPADVCSVLVRDYFEKLSKDEKIFCKNIILEVATSSFNPSSSVSHQNSSFSLYKITTSNCYSFRLFIKKRLL